VIVAGRCFAVAHVAAFALVINASPAVAGAWLQPAVDLAAAGAVLTQEEPLVAMAPNGDATVVWLEHGDCALGSCTENQVMTRQVRADGSLGQVRRLTADNTDLHSPNDAEEPRLAVDGAGRALVAWLRPTDGGEARVEAVMIGAGGTPLAAAQPISPDGDHIGEMGLGINAAGQGVVAWSDDGGVVARRFGESGPAAGTTTLHPPTAGHFIDDPIVTVDPTGAATAAWTDLDLGPSHSLAVEARRLGATDVTGTLHELDTWSDTIRDPLAIDVHDASGTVTVLWSHPGPPGLKAARITAGDVLEPVGTPIAFDEAANPDLAVAPDGSALAVFEMRLQPMSPTKNIIGKRIAPDGSTGNLLFISDNDINAFDPQVDMGPDGTAFVGWHELLPTRNVMAARIPAGGGPEDPVPLAEDASTVESAAVAADRDGSALVAFWRRDNGDAVRAMHYDGEPPVISAFGFPRQAFTGQELFFGALVADDLSELSGLTWTFGDGGTGTDALLSHAYAQPGTFPVELVVGDTAGNTTSRGGPVTVSSLPEAPSGGGGQGGGGQGGGGQGGGGTATAGSPPAGGTGPGKTTPAKLSFTLGRLPAHVRRRILLSSGLPVRLTAQDPTSFTIELVSRLRRGVRIARTGDVVLAARRLGEAAGTRTARLGVPRSLRKLVRRGARLQVRITASGADGGTATITRGVRVR
jgi:PKD domain-containing protein